MKILFIIPGAGDNFYCGNCFRDNLYASALRKAGHDVIISPLYLPLKHASFQTDSPLFFPATSYYIGHKFFRNSKLPAWIEQLTNSDFLLSYAASKSGTTSAKGLEEMTLSMITGEDAVFLAEIDKMMEWIQGQEKPDVIHLSSSLLIGIARILRTRLQIPIVCSLQDEEVWIDDMEEPYATRAWQQIDQNRRYVDQLITTSEYYKKMAQERLSGDSKIEVIYPGFDEEIYADAIQAEEPVIGFFYRMCEKSGLHILVDAFLKLKQKNSLPGLKLKVGGGFNDLDKAFLKELKAKLAPYKDEVEFRDSYSLDDHRAFYQSISVISVPITFNEGIGLYLCEAFAAGVPAVQPASGSIPEIVADAGILYQPNTAEALALALEQALADPNRLRELQTNARLLAQERYSASVAANKLLQVYQASLNSPNLNA